MDTSQASTNNSEAQKLIWDITTNRRHPVCQFFDCYDGYRKDCINRVAGRVACKRCAWEKTAQKAQPSTDVMAKHLAECHRKKHREFLQRMKTWKKVDNKKNTTAPGEPRRARPISGKPAETPNLTANPIGPEMQSENITETYIKISVTMTRWIMEAYHRRIMEACEEDKPPENLSEALPRLEDRSNSPASPEMQEKIEKFKDLFPRHLKRAASSRPPISGIGTAVPHRKFSQRKSEDGQRIIFERESCASQYVTVVSLDKQAETFEVSRNGTIIRKMEVPPVRVKARDFKNEALPAPTEQYEAEADVPESSGRAAERPEIARKTESQDLAVPFDPLPSGLLFRRGPELRMHALGKRPPEYKPRKEKQELRKRSYEAQSQHCLLRPDVEKVIGGSEDLRVEGAPAPKKKLFSHAAILKSYAPSGAHTTQNIQSSKLQSPRVDIFQI